MGSKMIPMEYDGIRWNTMEYDGIRWNTMEYDGIRWNTMEYDGTRWNTMEHDGILSQEHHLITIVIPLDHDCNTVGLVL